MEEYCTSCNVRLVERGFTTFPCPNCGEFEIKRCVRCRKLSNPYTCPKCGFVGP
ncbi:MAG: zinc finger domain-containing protein [Candidatus Alkanophagales archaeon]